ncbi:MAG: site-specific integrase [Desulfobacterales bacterium]|nr:site-specific integrase [Desulfobacterales bacterium]
MGSLYLRGKTWWMKIPRKGETPLRKSTGEKVKMRAREVLRKAESEVSAGERPFFEYSETNYSELVSLIENDYVINKQNLRSLTTRLNNLKYFENFKAHKINSVSIMEYIGFRLQKGASNATINRELAALRRMFRLANEQTPPLIEKVPVFKMLKEKNVRKGFFEHDEFIKIRENLPEFLRPVITFGYFFGWRKEEILTLRWSSVDIKSWIVRLEVGEGKTEEGRTVYLNDELKNIFQELWNNRKEKGIILPWVFPNRKHTDRVYEFRKTWNKAFEGSGIDHKIFHDLRRTAVRNMVRAGVPERVAMLLSGHKTRSVFDRYNIVNDNDLKNAQKSIDNFLGTNLGTITNLEQKKSP